DVIVESNMSPSTRNCDRVVNAVSFDGSPGYAKIRKLGDDVDNCLYVLALDRSALGTLHGFFEEPYWGQAQRKTQQEDVIATKQGTQVTNEEQRQRQEQEQSQSSVSVHSPVYVAWGTQQAYYNSQSKTLEVYYGEEETELTLISLKPPSNSSTPNASYPLPFVHTIPLTPHHVTSTLDLTPQLRSWQKRVSDLANLNWRPTSLKQSPLEHGLISGHILYKTCFPAEYKVLKSKVRLLINARHRCSIFLNDHFVGGHTVYSKRLCVPGCKNGPELLTSFGKKKYDLTQFLKLPKSEEANVLIIVVENLGINRQMDMFNDARNPRGLISASFTGLKSGNKPQWSICGVDARRLDCSFITSGIPDEHKRTGWISLPSLPESGINPSDGLSWWKFSFLHPVSSKLRSELSAPLRLVLYGSFTSYIFLNGTLIGRYYGNGDSPQHDFYLMDGLLKHDEDNTIALLVYSWEPVISPDLKVQVRGWEIDDANKSGNVARLRRGTEDVESASNGWVVWKASINL
ncbi:2005_t:CDS:1, partial [Paraglomus occultum]